MNITVTSFITSVLKIWWFEFYYIEMTVDTGAMEGKQLVIVIGCLFTETLSIDLD